MKIYSKPEIIVNAFRTEGIMALNVSNTVPASVKRSTKNTTSFTQLK